MVSEVGRGDIAGGGVTQAMATSSFLCQPPEPYTFANPEEWPTWKRRFERFRVVSGLAAKPGTEQVNALIYFMGDKADDILLSLNLREAQMADYNAVIQAFETHFVVRRNIVYERATFHRRYQKEGESVEEFITDLHKLAKFCNFGALHDEMIRDRIVVGLRDHKLSERMQLDPDLTLEKATNMARQSEVVKDQQTRLHTSDVTSVDRLYVSKRGPLRKGNRGERVGGKTEPTSTQFQTPTGHCSRSGKSQHGKEQCPARKAMCNKCHIIGHYARQCRNSAALNQVSSTETAFLGDIDCESSQQWTATVQVGERPIVFKVDTGADVTVIPAETYEACFSATCLQTPTKILKGPGRHELDVLGMITKDMTYRTKSIKADLYIVNNLDKPLLSRDASEKLGIVKKICDVTTRTGNVKPEREFPKLFSGLGHVKEVYKIELRDDAVPLALMTPWRVAIPLLNKTKEKLEEMVKMQVIEPVEEPSEWCSGMVIVGKSNGDVRICVDLTELNEYVKREVHPLPIGEQVLGQLAGAKFFSKIDANSGFWQFELAKE